MKLPRRSLRSERTQALEIRKRNKSTSLLDYAPVNYLVLDSSGVILEANLPAARLLGKEIHSLKRLPLREFIHERDRDNFDHYLDRCLRNGHKTMVELRLDLPGHPLVELTSSVFRPSRSRKVLLQTVLHEQATNGGERSGKGRREEEVQRLSRTLKALSKSSQAMTRAVDESGYMSEVCRIVQEDCGHAMVWIGFANDDAVKSIMPVAHAGFEEGYLETLRLTWADTERGRGPTGTAIRTGRPCMCRNMLTDPQFKPWREEAVRRGYAASIALPLTCGGKTFGALMIYSREPDPFSEDEVELLSGLADDLAYGLTAVRLKAAHEVAEESLRESEERHRALFENMTEGFALHEIITDSHGMPRDYRFLEVNPSFERLTGLKRADLLRKRVLEVLPANESVWIERYGKVALTGEPTHFESFSAPLDRWYEVFAYCPAPLQFAVIFTDITERKRAEVAQREVEEHVRRKLDSVLMPEGDLGVLELGDLMDVPAMQKLMDDFYAVARFPMSIIDIKGKVLVGVGWQDICTRFHRVHPDTCKRCVESDTQLSAGVPRGEFRQYKCKNNLWDIATPITVGDRQMGSVFSGQFFFEDESVDREAFREQARRYGFDQEAYLAALDHVPRLSRETVKHGMAFLLKLADTLSQLGFSNAKLARLVAERDRLTASLHEEQERLKRSQEQSREIAEKYSALFNTTSDGVCLHDLSGKIVEVNDAYCRMSGYSSDEILQMPVSALEVNEGPREIADHVQKLIEAGGHDRFEARHRRKDGSVFNVDVTALYIEKDGGRVAIFVRDITERKTAEEQTFRKNAVLSGIARIFREALTCETEKQLGRVCLDVAQEVTQSKFGFVGEISQTTGRMVDIAISDPGWNACRMQGARGHRKEKLTGFEIHGLYGKVVREGKGFFTNDPQSHPDSIGTPKGHPVLTAFLGVPLVHAGETIGLVGLGNREGGYGPDELEAADGLTAAIVQAFLRKRAERELNRRTEQFALLSETAGALLVSTNPQVVVDELCRKVMAHLDCEVFIHFLVDEHEGRLHLNACAGIPDEDLGRVEWVNYGSDMCGRVARDGQRIIIENIQRTSDEHPDLIKSLGVQAYCCHPLLSGDRVIGTLGFGSRHRSRFADDEIELMHVVSDQVSVAMGRIRAESALRELNAQLEQRVQERTAALRKTTEALEAERKRFIDVLDLLPAYVVLLTPDHQVPFANRFFEERFGKSLGRRCYEYLFNRSEPCEVCETFKVLQSNSPTKWEWTGPDSRIYDISDFPFTDTYGSKLVLEMGLDITERKRAEAELEKHRAHLEDLVQERTSQLSIANRQLQSEITERREAEHALQESEERFRLAIQHSQLMAWQCNTDMRFTWVYNSHFGVPGNLLLGKTPADLGNEQGMHEFVTHGGEVLAQGQGTRKTIRQIHTDGREQYFDQQVEALRDPQGRIIGLIGISLDVTERVLAEQRLLKSEESFRLMIGHSAVPMLLVDERGTIECISRKACDQLGYPEADLVGTNVESFLDWSGKLDLTMRLEDFLRHGPLPARGVLRIKRGNGSWCWIDVQASFVNYGQRPEKYLLKFELIATDIPKQ